MAESIADRIAAEHEWAPFWCTCGEPVHDFAHLTTREMRDLHTRHVAAVTEAAVRAQTAGRIHSVELYIQHMLEEDPINPRLHGALSALQQARDIAEGKKLV